MFNSTKPLLFIIIISIISFFSFSFLLINFNNTIFKVEIFEFIGNQYNYYNKNNFYYKYQYVEHEKNISREKNGNINSIIQKTIYSSNSPLGRFFTGIFNLSLSYLVLVLIFSFLLFALNFTNLLKCNFEIREMIRNGDLSAFQIKRKRNIFLSFISFLYIIIVGITFGIVISLPLNLPTYFIKQDRFDHFTDHLCNIKSDSSISGYIHIGKCKQISGSTIFSLNDTNNTLIKYNWGIGEFNIVIKTIVLTTILLGLFLFLLICLLKLKKPLNNNTDIENNNNNNSNNNNNNINQENIPSPTPIPAGKSILISN